MDRNATEFETLDEAMRAVCGPRNASGLTVGAWAHRLGHAESTMYAKGQSVPFTLGDLEKITAHGFLLPLKWLANAGHAVVFPRPQDCPENPLNVKTAESVIKFGKFLRTLARAQETDSPGGVDITVAEARRVKGDALESIAAQAAVIDLMEQIITADSKESFPCE
jgi:hypothetical protein